MISIDVDAVVGYHSTALIVCASTGIFYEAQCGGMACTHPKAEGYVISLGDFMQDFDTCEFGCFDMDQDPLNRIELMEAANKYCASGESSFHKAIRFDYDRIEEAQEGWIPVKLNGKFRFPEIEFVNEIGFIHNFNCD